MIAKNKKNRFAKVMSIFLVGIFAIFLVFMPFMMNKKTDKVMADSVIVDNSTTFTGGKIAGSCQVTYATYNGSGTPSMTLSMDRRAFMTHSFTSSRSGFSFDIDFYNVFAFRVDRSETSYGYTNLGIESELMYPHFIWETSDISTNTISSSVDNTISDQFVRFNFDALYSNNGYAYTLGTPKYIALQLQNLVVNGDSSPQLFYYLIVDTSSTAFNGLPVKLVIDYDFRAYCSRASSSVTNYQQSWNYFVSYTYYDADNNYVSLRFLNDSGGSYNFGTSTYYFDNYFNLNDNQYYEQGYNDGYTNGESAGFNSGNQAGYSAGYSAGQNAGYNAGIVAGGNVSWTNMFGAMVDVPVSSLVSMLDFNLNLGGQNFNLYHFLLAVLTLAITIAIVRLILAKGGK